MHPKYLVVLLVLVSVFGYGQEYLESDTLKVFPNPFMDQLTIELHTDQPEEILEMSIYTMTGSLIYRFSLEGIQTGNSHTVTWNGTSADGNPVQAGMYLLVYRTTKANKTIKIMKQ